MVESKRWAIKKFVREYAVTFITAIGLIVILIALLLARAIALGSLDDISKFNPLITSEQGQLVSVGDDGRITIIGEDELTGLKQAARSASAGSNTQLDDDSYTSPSADSDDRPSGASGGTGGTNTGGTNGSSPNPSPTTSPRPGGNTSPSPRPVLVATLGNVWPESKWQTGGISGIGTCVYRAHATISVNVPGTVNYKWTAVGVLPTVGLVTFQDGDSLQQTISHNLSAPGPVTFEITSPGSSSKTILVGTC